VQLSVTRIWSDFAVQMRVNSVFMAVPAHGAGMRVGGFSCVAHTTGGPP
jgi:hypothetical protein